MQTKPSPSSEILRQAAIAALENAQDLCAEAKLLLENDRNARSAALAVIGVEEFSKGVAYSLVAIFPELWPKLEKLTVRHDVKHWIADTFEGSQILAHEGFAITYEEFGVWPSADGVMTDIFVELVRYGLDKVIPNEKQAKKHKRHMKSDNDRWISTPFIKDAAFYVDLSEQGEVLYPSRVARFAAGEVVGLEWYLKYCGPLRDILLDDSRWAQFSETLRKRVE